MTLTKTLVVSNHANHDLEWLKMTYEYGFSPENTIIYDRTPDDFVGKSKIDHLGKVIKSPNLGSNPYDIGRYIVDYYDDLPDMMIHIKGNLLQKKYTTKERFIYALNSNWLVPIDRGELNSFHNPLPYLVNDEWFSHPMHWYDNNPENLFGRKRLEGMKIRSRLPTFRSFIHDLFVIDDRDIPKNISFAPGANYAVPKHYILKYSKNFYRKMMHYSDYENNPIEAHWFERIYLFAWQGCLEENFSYIVEEK